MQTLHYSTTIDARPEHVWNTMLSQDTYRIWTSPFTEGSYYDGSWDEGAEIRFLSPGGDGMISEIAESRPHEFLSIRHLGMISKGVVDTESEEVRKWAPSFENYTFSPVGTATELQVDVDVMPGIDEFMADVWPRALVKLKELCESAPSITG